MQPIIEIEDLSLAYLQDGITNEILHGLDLTIERGEFLAIVGASGVGKSTLLRVLMNLSAPSTGRVSVNVDPSSQRAMALVFQDARLLPWRRVLDNVTFGLEKTTASRQERRRKGLDVLRKVGIELLADRYPRQLSGGQRQRVALARALAVDAPILLMDEPFSALDALTREGLQDVLTRVWTTFGKTVLFVTHDIDEAVYLADRVIALGGQPGQVKASVAIDAPRPRSRHDPSLQSFAEKVRAQLVADALPSEDWVI